VAHPGIEPSCASKHFAVSSLAGRLRSPLLPIDQGALHSPYGTLDQPCADWMPPTVSARWITASVSPLDFDQGSVLGCMLNLHEFYFIKLANLSGFCHA